MDRLKQSLYLDDLDFVCGKPSDWSALANKVVAVSGATGMIGTVLVDSLLRKNDADGLGCRVVALGRSAERAARRLPYGHRSDYAFEEMDVSVPGARMREKPDVVFHLASATHPRQYATQPVGTITANVTGTVNLMECLDEGGAFVLASSVEIYGQNRGDVDLFDEGYLGWRSEPVKRFARHTRLSVACAWPFPACRARMAPRSCARTPRLSRSSSGKGLRARTSCSKARGTSSSHIFTLRMSLRACCGLSKRESAAQRTT